MAEYKYEPGGPVWRFGEIGAALAYLALIIMMIVVGVKFVKYVVDAL